LYLPTIDTAAFASTSTARLSSIPARRFTGGDYSSSLRPVLDCVAGHWPANAHEPVRKPAGPAPAGAARLPQSAIHWLFLADSVASRERTTRATCVPRALPRPQFAWLRVDGGPVTAGPIAGRGIGVLIGWPRCGDSVPSRWRNRRSSGTRLSMCVPWQDETPPTHESTPGATAGGGSVFGYSI
jgi:hypothetical protein